MTISGGRTEQLDVFCRVTGFSSDFLSFIVVELIRFFHGALHFFKVVLGSEVQFMSNAGVVRYAKQFALLPLTM